MVIERFSDYFRHLLLNNSTIIFITTQNTLFLVKELLKIAGVNYT